MGHIYLYGFHSSVCKKNDDEALRNPLKMEPFVILPFSVCVGYGSVQHTNAEYLGHYNLQWHV